MISKGNEKWFSVNNRERDNFFKWWKWKKSSKSVISTITKDSILIGGTMVGKSTQARRDRKIVGEHKRRRNNAKQNPRCGWKTDESWKEAWEWRKVCKNELSDRVQTMGDEYEWCNNGRMQRHEWKTGKRWHDSGEQRKEVNDRKRRDLTMAKLRENVQHVKRWRTLSASF